MQLTVKFLADPSRLEIEADGKTTGTLTLGEAIEQIAEYYYNQKFRYHMMEIPQDEPR